MIIPTFYSTHKLYVACFTLIYSTMTDIFPIRAKIKLFFFTITQFRQLLLCEQHSLEKPTYLPPNTHTPNGSIFLHCSSSHSKSQRIPQLYHISHGTAQISVINFAETSPPATVSIFCQITSRMDFSFCAAQKLTHSIS